MKGLAHKRQVKHTSTATEPSNPFQTLVKLVDAEDVTDEKIRLLDLSLENKKVTSKLEVSTLPFKTYDPYTEIMFTRTIDPKKETPVSEKNVIIVINPITVSNCFRKQREDEEKKRNNSFSQ